MVIAVRDMTDEDVAAVQAIYAPYCEASAVSFEERAPSVDDLCARRSAGSQRFPWIVAELERSVVGYAYASQHRARAAYRWSCDTSVYVRPEAQGSGVGRMLYGELLARLRALGYVRAHAGITLPNPRASACTKPWASCTWGRSTPSAGSSGHGGT